MLSPLPRFFFCHPETCLNRTGRAHFCLGRVRAQYVVYYESFMEYVYSGLMEDGQEEGSETGRRDFPR